MHLQIHKNIGNAIRVIAKKFYPWYFFNIILKKMPLLDKDIWNNCVKGHSKVE